MSASADFGGMGDSASAHRSKKNKKHKKRHKHDRHESSAGLDEAVPGHPIKIRIRVGGDEEPKKRKKKKKDKDKEKKHKHKHRDKRKSEAAEKEEAAVGGEAVGESGPPAKRLLLEAAAVSQNTTSPRPRTPCREKDQQSCVIATEGDQSQRKALSKLLDHCLPMLEKKDNNGFFSNPVTDLIAPGYSQIIKKPMDFLTMRTKLAAGSYNTLKDFSGKCFYSAFWKF